MLNGISFFFFQNETLQKLPALLTFISKGVLNYHFIFYRIFQNQLMKLMKESSNERIMIIFKHPTQWYHFFFGQRGILPWWRSAWGPWWHSWRPWYQDVTPPYNPAQSRVLWLRRSRLHDGLARDARSVDKGYWSPWSPGSVATVPGWF